MKSDRLLIIGSGEIELIIFELLWFDNENKEDPQDDLFSSEFAANNETQTKKSKLNEAGESLIGGNLIEDENAQANVILILNI